MKQLKYFNHCKTLDEIKSEYKMQAQQWLSTEKNAGEPSLMTSLDNEYYEISQRPKFKQQSQEIQEEFLAFPKIVKELISLELNLEICGVFLWVSGNTYDHVDKLKELGLKFSPAGANLLIRAF